MYMSVRAKTTVLSMIMYTVDLPEQSEKSLSVSVCCNPSRPLVLLVHVSAREGAPLAS